MFDYYRFRYKILKDWNPELGYELVAPAGIFGATLVVFILIVTSSDVGLFIGVAKMPVPGVAALGLVITLVFLAHIADDLKRLGLLILCFVCAFSLLAVLPLTLYIRPYYEPPLLLNPPDTPSVIAIGAGFATYLIIMLSLTVSRLRQ